MRYNLFSAIENVIQTKTARYNKAMDDVRTSEANEYLNQLKGMQEILAAMGIEMGMDKGSHTGWDLVCNIEK